MRPDLGTSRRGFLMSVACCGRSASIPWNLAELRRTPQIYPAPAQQEEGVRALFFESEPWNGRPTRVFAWYGFPKAARGPSPAMVLVHGGGGTAYAEWVRMWNRRGFAAIAMDTNGSVPLPRGTAHPLNVPHQRHEFGGPEAWGGFDQIDRPLKDQWTYHAIAAVVRAHSLVRSQTEVDPGRVGLTGISWGGYLTSIAGSIDRRFRFAAPVYGCGFANDEESAWRPTLDKMSSAQRRLWLDTWDASQYLKLAKIPFLWVSGSDDRYYPLPTLQKSYRLARPPRLLSIVPGMKHSHPDGAKPEEIPALAAELLTSAAPLLRIHGQGISGDLAWAQYRGDRHPAIARLHYTDDSGPWLNRAWKSEPARIEIRRRRVECAVPSTARAFFLNLTDERKLVVSTEHMTR